MISVAFRIKFMYWKKQNKWSIAHIQVIHMVLYTLIKANGLHIKKHTLSFENEKQIKAGM